MDHSDTKDIYLRFLLLSNVDTSKPDGDRYASLIYNDPPIFSIISKAANIEITGITSHRDALYPDRKISRLVPCTKRKSAFARVILLYNVAKITVHRKMIESIDA